MTQVFDFDDSLDGIFGSDVAPVREATRVLQHVHQDVAPVFQLPQAQYKCPDCRGTGRWNGGTNSYGTSKCRKCAGKGFLKSSPHDRAKRSQRAFEKKVEVAADFVASPEGQYLQAKLTKLLQQRSSFADFVGSLFEAGKRYGYLTANQLASIEKMKAKDAEFAARDAQPKADHRKAIDTTGIEAAFAAAAAKGRKQLALFLGDFCFSPAAGHSANAGWLYVKRISDKQYLGKTKDGKFQPTRECDADTAIQVVTEASSITDFESIKVRGQDTGICCCCGAELTDPVSIAAGIGPICAGKWGY